MIKNKIEYLQSLENIMANYKTVVTKKIGRKINTGQYESADIVIEAQDEIEWSSIEERDKKLHKLTQLAIKDFQDTFVEVTEALGIQEKRAFVKNHGAKSAEPPKDNPKSKIGDDDFNLFDEME